MVLRRRLPRYQRSPPSERGAYHTTHRLSPTISRIVPDMGCLPIHLVVASRLPQYQRSSAHTSLRTRLPTRLLTRHTSSPATACNEQQTHISHNQQLWRSERVGASLVLPARGCIRGIGGYRCTPIAPVVAIVGYRWAGRLM